METTFKELKILLRNSKASGSPYWIVRFLKPLHGNHFWSLIFNLKSLSIEYWRPFERQIDKFWEFGSLLKEFGTKNMENVRLEIKDIEKLRYESSSLILYKELSE